MGKKLAYLIFIMSSKAKKGVSKMKKAVIYTCHLEGRISEPDNAMQEQLCREYAQQHGIEIVGFYMDCVSTKHQPLLMKQRLLDDCKQRSWDMVIFPSLSILGRKINNNMEFLSKLSKYVKYIVVDQENDPFLREVDRKSVV